MTRLLEVEAYALRYWEEEFPILRPSRNSAGHRIYSEEDLEAIRRIKELLYEERYTIPGARRRLAEESSGESPEPLALEADRRALVHAAGDKGGGAAIRLDATIATAERIEMKLDRLAERLGTENGS